MRRIIMYIYEHPDWPLFRWRESELMQLLAQVRNRQGSLVGKMNALGFDLVNEAVFATTTTEVIKSSEIEGEILNVDQVRSSLARRLGLDVSGMVPSDRHVDGIVDMTVDATENYRQPLTRERLFGWHNALFPAGYSGMYKVLAGRWRNDSTGPMQVVSGALGKEKVHFQAPGASLLDREMEAFLSWLNQEPATDLVIKAAVAHLWFVTIHPFEDGNGRIARAVTDMILAQSDGQPQRFYSMSSQIRIERKQYYSVLEKTQKGNLDISTWIKWFLSCLLRAIEASDEMLQKVVFKHRFWTKNALLIDNDRQNKMLNLLLDDFKGKLTSGKWAKICKCSQDTALRDIQALVKKGILARADGGGRSTGYYVRREV